MDEVYGFHNKTSSDLLSLSKYFKEYNELTNLKSLAESKNQSNSNPKEGILEIMEMDIGDEDFAALSEYCSVENLEIPGTDFEKPVDAKLSNGKYTYEPKGIPDNVDLQTLTKLKERLQYSQRPINYNLKYRSEISIQPDAEKAEMKKSPLIEPGNDILVFVRVYAPFLHQSRVNSMYAPKIFTSHIVAILGSQTLDQLRDMISCVSDLSISTEISEDPKAECRIQAKDVYKSGFFYIEGTFYNDFRESTNRDNSEVIRDWAKNRKLGPFKSTTMEGTTVNSLDVRFGYPWVYQHQGTCEHILVFSDARLISSSDQLSVSSYPRIHRLRASSTRYCMVCGVFAASWITTNNERLPHDPCYFCNTCFHSFNYIDGKKIGNFKAYPVPSNTDVTQDRENPEGESLSKS